MKMKMKIMIIKGWSTNKEEINNTNNNSCWSDPQLKMRKNNIDSYISTSIILEKAVG